MILITIYNSGIHKGIINSEILLLNKKMIDIKEDWRLVLKTKFTFK